MSIIIKELFESDLDQHTTYWWSSKKIEKLNFNFDQIVTSGGGPSGPTGFPGDQGPDGIKGPIGIQGSIGHQGHIGPKGSDGINTWNINKHDSSIPSYNKVITLKPNQFNKLHPTTINIGVKNDTTGELSYNSIITKHLARIHTKDATVKNIVFSTDENGVEVYLNMYGLQGIPTLEKSFNQIDNNVFRFKAKSHILKQSILNDSINYCDINDIKIKVSSTNSYFGTTGGNQNTELRVSTKFNTSAPQNNWIAQSESADGKIKWVDPMSVIPSFPVGSIVGIRLEDFLNDDNFWNNETNDSQTDYLRNRDGSGKANSFYEGWYICNGETWKKGAISFELPNLNSYSYIINSNPETLQDFKQNLVDDLSILMSSDISFNLNYSSNTYSASNTISSWKDELISFKSSPSSAELKNSKIIYLCYLKEKDLYWETEISEGPTLYNIALTSGSSSNTACAASNLLNYLVDFDPNEISWTNLSNPLIGYSLYNLSGTALAHFGWYTRDGISRYWSGTAFTQIAVCTSYTALSARYSTSVYGLNGSSSPYHDSTSVDVFSDNSSFINSTKLYTNSNASTYASSGWYRIGNTRRFWNFTTGEFLGVSINSDFIINLIDGSNNAESYTTNNYGAKASSLATYCNAGSEALWLYTNSGVNLSDSDSSISDVFTNHAGYGSEGTGPLILIPAFDYYSDDDGGISFARYSSQAGYLALRTFCSFSSGSGGGSGAGSSTGGAGGIDREEAIRAE
jgi:hypothetical protein